MTDLFLGVDAGNTKTIAAVADRHGNVVGWARGGLGDIYGVDDPGEAVAAVLRLVDEAVGSAQDAVPGGRLASAAFCLAGVDWPEDTALWTEVLTGHLGPDVRLSVKNDGFALLRCGDPDGVGVAVSLGTGAAIAGRGPTGTEFAFSFWLQHPLGAAGLVDDALHAIFRAHTGLTSGTSLSQAIPEYYEAASVEDLLHRFTRRESAEGSHHDKAKAARVVLREAERGDLVAVGIVDQHAERIAAYVEACANQVALDEPFALTLGGSVAADITLRKAILRELSRQLPHVDVAAQPAEPILGTILDALAEGGVPPTPAVRATVLDSPSETLSR
ncbi:N-acetylglucosamine kinase-like BadF-type ATPase [Kribbella aluminosa]|uniref:N-acetylglucosamine kinase-like BadF-type ATPase n=1 Tax=Kribbella aluminosa TaxID=416017 RepID=A0ABS4UJ17_9ACTN|nr:BadF/BadG/BcrA/BcrD ATPase family protein [Kribbella aluminosa]MBP2351638.1 N-acetylglucosamine kinase-like BadF-type ATPase [Kribbella aluminosa]